MHSLLLFAVMSLGASEPPSLKAKLALLVETPTSPIPKELPGLSRFLGITGDTRSSRELYVEMMNRHSNVVEAFEKDPKEGNRLISEFMAEASERTLVANGFDAMAAATLRITARRHCSSSSARIRSSSSTRSTTT